MLNFLGIMGLREEHPGGTELRILITPLAREFIRAAVMIIGLGLTYLIYLLLP